MGSLCSRFLSKVRHFVQDTRGVVLAEMIFALIIVNFVLVAFFVWWEAYRAQARVERVAYTMSDLISRQRGTTLTRPFLDGLERTAEFLLTPDQDAAIRFTQVTRVSGTHPNLSGLAINWSYSPCNRFLPAQNDPTFSRAAFPMMAVGATMIMVEVRVPFEPPAALDDLVGLEDRVFTRSVVAMPRFESNPFTVPASPAGTTTCIN